MHKTCIDNMTKSYNALKFYFMKSIRQKCKAFRLAHHLGANVLVDVYPDADSQFVFLRSDHPAPLGR